MKKNKISVIAASLLMAVVGLAGCSTADEEESKTVSKVTLSGISTTYKTGETIAWADLKITATYSNKSSETFSAPQIEFDITSELKDATEVVVYTEGLHSQETAQDGVYNIKAAFKADLSHSYDVDRIVVGTITADKYDLISFEDPANISAYNLKRQANPQSEGGFYSTSELLTVGQKNAFKYEPQVSFRNKATKKIESSPNYEKDFSLREIVGETRTDVNFGTYAEKVAGGLKFKDAAVGKTFELRCVPSEFDSVLGGSAPVLTLDFKVADGLNIYTAKELGALNLTHFTVEDFANPETSFAYHYGKNATYGTRENSVSRNFWNSSTGNFDYCDTTAEWKKFLKDSGTFTTQELVDYQDISGVYLQNNIEINKDDIPQAYFINGKEAQSVDTDGDGVYDCEGCIRDDVSVYTPIINEKDVVVNGNYFTLGSKLGVLRNLRGDGTATYYHDTYNINTTFFQEGHASVLHFCGLWSDRDTYFKNKVDTANGYRGIVKNLDTNGFVSADFNAKQREGESNEAFAIRQSQETILAMTGLIFVKNSFCGADYINNIVKQYQIGLFTDDVTKVQQTADVREDRVHNGPHNDADHPVKFNSLIKDCKVYDCANCGICNWRDGAVFVEHSEFKRFGGAPVCNFGYKGSQQDFDEKGIPLDARRGSIYFTSDCVLENYISGTETYYVAVHASELIGQLKVWAGFFEDAGYTFRFEKDGVEKFNCLTLNMDGSAIAPGSAKDFYADVVLDYDKADGTGYLEAGNNENAGWTYYNALGRQAPIFITDKGEVLTCFYQGTPGSYDFLLDLSTGSPKPLGPDFKLEGTKFAMYIPCDWESPNVVHTTLVASFTLAPYTPAA